MTIVLCGGGSGGHITPLLAVASELRKQNKQVRIVYIGEKHGKFSHIASDSRLFNELHYISAGKLRRYHGESAFHRLLDVKTILLNFRDLFRLLRGLVQSYFLLRKLRPAAILLKGGFVCVPVSFAARLNRIPYITHDSDALPGLSNQIAARGARYHATALPAKYYDYPPKTVKAVGVPSDERFREYSVSEQRILREKFGIKPSAKILLITGGSNGARRLNTAVISILPRLLEAHPDLYVMHQVGAGNEDQTREFNEKYRDRVNFFDFSPEIFHMSAIADVIVARSGASAMADYALQRKACIIVPNPYLTGGHQLKNATVYQEAGAAVVVHERELVADPGVLFKAVDDLLKDPSRRHQLAGHLHALAPKTSAAESLASLLSEISA